MPARRSIMVAVLAGLLALAPPAAALEACKCEDFSELQIALAQALLLKSRFSQKAAEIAATHGQNPTGSALAGARRDFEQFVKGTGEGTAGHGLRPSPAGSPERVEYVNRGTAEQDRWLKEFNRTGRSSETVGIRPGLRNNEVGELVVDQAYRDKVSNDWKKAGKNLCEPADPKGFTESLGAGARCAGIAKALIEHERVHQQTCERMGFWAFGDRTPHQILEDEVRAYTRQAEVLAGEIQRVMGQKRTRVIQKPAGACPECYLEVKVECLRSYHVNGAKGGIVFRQGLVCNVYKPFSLKSVGMSKVDFAMTPKGETPAGSYSYSGTGGGARFSGSGFYSIAVGENDAKITLYSEGIADTPRARVEDKGAGTFTMTPLEKNCDE